MTQWCKKLYYVCFRADLIPSLSCKHILIAMQSCKHITSYSYNKHFDCIYCFNKLVVGLKLIDSLNWPLSFYVWPVKCQSLLQENHYISVALETDIIDYVLSYVGRQYNGKVHHVLCVLGFLVFFIQKLHVKVSGILVIL